MYKMDYLIVYGRNVQRNLPCYRETEMTKAPDEFCDIIKAIEDNMSEDKNWTGGVTLEPKDGRYVETHHIYEMYPQFSHDVIDEFSKYLPEGITKIESIKIFRGEKIKLI